MPPLLRYFDLNSSTGTLVSRSSSLTATSHGKTATAASHAKTVSVAPAKTKAPAVPATTAQTEGVSMTQQVIWYVGAGIGVAAKPAIDALANGQKWQFDPAVLVVSAVIALIVVPSAWKSVGAAKGIPAIVSLGLFVQQGYFWAALLGSLTKQQG